MSEDSLFATMLAIADPLATKDDRSEWVLHREMVLEVAETADVPVTRVVEAIATGLNGISFSLVAPEIAEQNARDLQAKLDAEYSIEKRGETVNHRILFWRNKART
jgi:hypothetical protein